MTYQSTIAGTVPDLAHPTVRKINATDLKEVLSKGFDDFWSTPTQVIFLCIIYPIVGFVLARVAFGQEMLPLLYPLVSGFALIGPFAALGLYQLSRRREQGQTVSWVNAFDVFRSPSLGSILLLGLILLVIFVAWLGSAQAIYHAIFGPIASTSIRAFVRLVIFTPRGWELFGLGSSVGFLFAAAVLALTVVSFPLLLDRNVGVIVAIQTSVRTVIANPAAMALWGLIVAASLLVACLPMFIGLAVVLPVLGHATWHLYRKTVA